MPSVASCLNTLQHFLSEIYNSSAFQLNRTPFKNQEEWLFQHGMLSHKTGGFFHIVGMNDVKNSRDQLYLFQPQSALTGVLICASLEEPYILTQARIEPGNTGVIQLGPTVQSTPANFLRLHKGKKTPYLDLLYSANHQLLGFSSTNHLDLGKLYYQKTKWLNYGLVDDLVETEDTFIWVSLSALAEAARTDYLINTDLRSLLAVFDWDSLRMNRPPAEDIAPSKILNYFLKQSQTLHCNNRFIDISTSNDLFVTDAGISLRDSPQDIGFYEVKTNHREVQTWVQPLWRAEGKGRVILLCRDFNDNPSFLLTVKHEAGTSSSLAISPTYLYYPDENLPQYLDDYTDVLIEFHQSDEGGRFINHEYLFQLIEVAGDQAIADNQFWVGIGELQKILSASNLANIQLRNICSVLINKLNPHTFRSLL